LRANFYSPQRTRRGAGREGLQEGLQSFEQSGKVARENQMIEFGRAVNDPLNLEIVYRAMAF
jgi:hypothetical protein